MKFWLGLLLLGVLPAACDDDVAPPLSDLSVFINGDLTAHSTGDAGITASVDIMDNFYAPRNVIVNRGGTVTWTWRGSSAHTVTNDSGSTEIFDSSPAKSTGTFAHTFNTAGAFGYHCMIHGAAMTGNITVQ